MWTIYRHYRGLLYVGVGTALHSEDLQPYQLYRCLYANELSRSWIRPFGMFHENLPSGEPRFTPVARIRTVAPEDEREVLDFGFDAWGGGKSRGDFIASYDGDLGHLKGVGYLLERLDGTAVSALKAIRLARHRVALARLATSPDYRRRGYATILVSAVMELLLSQVGELRLLLLSEIDPTFYGRLGFVPFPDQHQHYLPWVSMISGSGEISRLDADLVRMPLFSGIVPRVRALRE